ncbi:hypothetical protein [Paraburkholderia sp. SIMBA_030]
MSTDLPASFATTAAANSREFNRGMPRPSKETGARRCGAPTVGY